MGIERRIENLEQGVEKQIREDVMQIKAIVVREPGGRDPTEAEEEAAIEAYRQKHGYGPIALLTWDGEKFIDK